MAMRGEREKEQTGERDRDRKCLSWDMMVVAFFVVVVFCFLSLNKAFSLASPLSFLPVG
jgi:hypothetical protein